MIIYVDEVGYGSWAGPVVACSVMAPYIPNFPVKDSKKLTKEIRQKIMLDVILLYKWSLGWAHAHEIDSFGLRKATDIAISRSVHQLYNCKTEYVLLDGIYKPDLGFINVHNLVKGDINNLYISYASILAKQNRDKYMKSISYVGNYSWDQNVGYGTKKHIDAIEEIGVTKYHRMSYKPLKKYL